MDQLSPLGTSKIQKKGNYKCFGGKLMKKLEEEPQRRFWS